MKLLTRHSVLVYTLTDVEDGNEILDAEAIESRTVKCLVSPTSASVAFDSFGVNSIQPIIITAVPSDLFEVGGRVVWQGDSYAIKGINLPYLSTISGLENITLLCEKIND